MTQGVKDLISAIVEGDAATIDAAFNAEMATRVSSKLEDMRVSVAQNMFHVEQVEEATEEQVEETVEATEEVASEETVEAQAE
jgi:predicted LPLAT superfamily acyltransferase